MLLILHFCFYYYNCYYYYDKYNNSYYNNNNYYYFYYNYTYRISTLTAFLTGYHDKVVRGYKASNVEYEDCL